MHGFRKPCTPDYSRGLPPNSGPSPSRKLPQIPRLSPSTKLNVIKPSARAKGQCRQRLLARADQLMGTMPIPIRPQPAVPPLAPLIIRDRMQQICALEVGPQFGSDVDFGISNLPKQEIANAQLAAGADHQIRIRQASIKMSRDQLFIDVQMID